MTTAYRHYAAPTAEPPASLRLLEDDSLVRLLLVGIVGACLFHAAFAVRIAYIHAELIDWTQEKLSPFVEQGMDRTIEIETSKPEAPPPPPPLPDTQEEQAPPPPVATHEAEPQAPPAAAQAGQILAAQDDPNAPVDLTGDFVTGTGDRFAGGTTQAGGTSTSAVRNVAAVATGKPGGTGTGTAPPQTTDLSRAVQRAGAGDWNCPFPPESDLDQIDEAVAVVAVTVGPDGKVQSVSIDQDPGHGFGREARACALRERYVSALDRAGNAVVGTKKFRVTFTR